VELIRLSHPAPGVPYVTPPRDGTAGVIPIWLIAAIE
jgi:hypothetical protein